MSTEPDVVDEHFYDAHGAEVAPTSPLARTAEITVRNADGSESRTYASLFAD